MSNSGWKAKISHELVAYGINVVYLTIVFASFVIYRRLILASYDITYTNYFVSLIQALILGKVIMIGDVLHLGRGFKDKPLIYPTIYKTAVFTVFVGVFKVIEHVIVGLWHGAGVMASLAGFAAKGPHEILANSVMVIVAFLPFFAFRELGGILGRERIWALFFRRKADASTQVPGDA